MHSPAARSTHWLRRATALAAAVGLILITSLAPATATTRATATQQTGSSCPAPPPAPKLGVTVTGPQMYVPKTKDSHYSCHSTVTVSQTKDLVNQTVKVSWTGFTPTKPTPFSGGIPYSNQYSVYPVEVAECQGDSPGADPADLASHCYYAANSGAPYTNGKYGPSNDAWAITSAQGTGTVDIQIETFQQNQQLNCSATQDCSLLIMPVQGGIPGSQPGYPITVPTNCSNHSYDLNGDSSVGANAYGTAQTTLQPPAGLYGDTCSWPDRIVVPLRFAAIAKNCGFSNPAFSVAGSPMMVRAMTSWQSGLCNGAHPDPISYNGSVEEPEARSVFQQGGDDVALTTDPASGPGKYPYTYAPVGIAAAAVAYWVDDTKTGQPYTNLELTPLLLTKMLTQSYEYGASSPGFACTPQELQNPPTTAPGCDRGVLHDPPNLFADPEFRKVNPGLHLDEVQTSVLGIPTVQEGNSDMTWEVTRWIAADQASTSFLAGNVDAWGEHVNTSYLNTQYPTQQFIAKDGTGPVAYTYQPVAPPSRVAAYMADNQPSGNNWVTGPCIGSSMQNCPQPFTEETPGQRQLIAVLGTPDAAVFAMPTMKIENAAQKYVAPTAASMTAAVNNMVANGSNGITKAYNEAAKNPSAYPLTMVVYAMVPTGGISRHKASKIAQWLDYVAGPGEHQGMLPGQLPPGYLPLTKSMRAQTLKAAYDVLHQTGDHSSNGNGGSGGNGNGGGGGGAGGNGTGGSGSGHNGSSGKPSTTTGSGNPKNAANASFSSPFSGTGRLVLVILLIVGGLLALAGPAAIVLGKPGGRAAVIAGWHHVLALRHGTRILRGRKQP